TRPRARQIPARRLANRAQTRDSLKLKPPPTRIAADRRGRNREEAGYEQGRRPGRESDIESLHNRQRIKLLPDPRLSIVWSRIFFTVGLRNDAKPQRSRCLLMQGAAGHRLRPLNRGLAAGPRRSPSRLAGCGPRQSVLLSLTEGPPRVALSPLEDGRDRGPLAELGDEGGSFVLKPSVAEAGTDPILDLREGCRSGRPTVLDPDDVKAARALEDFADPTEGEGLERGVDRRDGVSGP